MYIEMRKISVVFSIFYALVGFGQSEIIVSGLNGPIGMEKHGDFLYVCESVEDRILRIDLSAPDPTPEVFVSGIDGPFFTLIHEDILYVSDYYLGRILSINLASPAPVVEVLVMGLTNPQDLFIKDNYLYVGQFSSGVVKKIDITSPNPTDIILTYGLESVGGIVIQDDFMYISDFIGDKIIRIDLTITDPPHEIIKEGLVGPNGGMKIYNNELYFFQQNSEEFSKIDLSLDDPEVINLDSGFLGGDILFDEADVYVTDFSNGNLIVYNDFVLNTDEFNKAETTLFPNPSSDNIAISGLFGATPYIIYNQLGVKVMEGVIFNESNIDIEVLPTGSYIIELERSKRMLFIKK